MKCRICPSYISGVLILCCYFVQRSLGDVFSSIAVMEAMLKAENKLYDKIEDYITAEQERLQDLRRMATNHVEKHAAMRNNSQLMGNPINIFKTMNRFRNTKKTIEQNKAESFVKQFKERHSQIEPNEQDFKGAAVAIFRLQDVYHLDADRMADGKILKNIKKTEPMNAEECFKLASVANDDNDFYHALMWAKEAYLKLDNEDPPSVEETEVLDYYGYALYKQGNYARALFIYQKLVSIDPENERGLQMVEYFKNYMEENDILPSPLPRIKNVRPSVITDAVEHMQYEKLCRNEFKMSAKKESKLYCHYKNDKPFLKLAPIKTEIVHLKPKIWIFRGIISDDEIKRVKKFALPKLNRATVHDRETNTFVSAEYRITQSAWFADEVDDLFDTISQRFVLATGLNMKYAEQLQVANYGIGGHYEPHYDMSTEGEPADPFESDGWGNRVATMLCYLSQPEAGGATVFVDLKLTVMPTKNDAVFWFNLRPDLTPDYNTKHAGCPVLSGIKWVANKWIHSKNQDLERPCGLTPTAYE